MLHTRHVRSTRGHAQARERTAIRSVRRDARVQATQEPAVKLAVSTHISKRSQGCHVILEPPTLMGLAPAVKRTERLLACKAFNPASMHTYISSKGPIQTVLGVHNNTCDHLYPTEAAPKHVSHAPGLKASFIDHYCHHQMHWHNAHMSCNACITTLHTPSASA